LTVYTDRAYSVYTAKGADEGGKTMSTKFTKRNGSLSAVVNGVEYIIVKRSLMGMVSYRVISWTNDEMTVHAEFGWMRDARAFISTIEN
jgi:hypothetical protein